MTFKVESSWDDGDLCDLMLVELLTRFGIPATFYLPGTSKLPTATIREISERFEVGGHTMSHLPDLKKLSTSMVEQEIVEGNRWLEDITGKKVEKFCYPRGKYDLRAVDIVRNIGMKEARTVDVGHLTYDDPHRKPTTVHVSYPRREYRGEDWLVYARRKLRLASKEGGIFHFWGHSWEVERLNDWQKVEIFFREVKAYMDEGIATA